MEKIELNSFTGYAILLLLGAITSTIGIFLVLRLTPKAPVSPPVTTSTPVIVTPQPSEYPDFDSRLKLKKLPLVQDFISWTPNANKEPSMTTTTIFVQNGDLAKAYIYIRASLNDKALTQWESVFIQMNNQGGHLFRPQSLPVPPGEKTELFYALNYIPYLAHTPYSENRTPAVTDWFSLLKNKREIKVFSFISSLRPAKLEEVTIYYQCINDEQCELVKK